MKILYLSNFVDATDVLGFPFLLSRIKALQKLNIEVEAVQLVQYPSKYHNKIVRFLYYLLMRMLKKDGQILTRNYTVDNCSFLLHKIEIFEYKQSKIRQLKERLFEQLVADMKPDLIHVHFLWHAELAYRFNKKTGFPYVVTAHGSDVHQTMHDSKEKRELFLEILQKSSKNIFVSNVLRKEAILMGMDKKNSTVIHNGVDAEVFFNKHMPRKNVVGFVGHLYRVKGADRLPQIFKLIAEKIDDVQFLIVGSGSEYENLQPTIKDELNEYGLSDRVIFVGEVAQKELNSYYNQMKVMILPSRNEGFGCVIKEAQTTGVWVIGSSNGGIPEAIGDAGKVVRDDKDFELLMANAVVEYIEKENNVEKSIQVQTWTEVVKSEIEIYKEVIREQ